MTLESACIPIPSEADDAVRRLQRLPRATYPLLGGRSSWRVAANLLGSWIAYAVGYYGRIELLEKHGNIAPHQALSTSSGPTAGSSEYGDGAVFFSRMLPIIRTFISLPGGRGADAVLALHGADRARAACRGSSC